MKKQLTSILIALCMVLTLLPTTALAIGWTTDRTIHAGWYYLRCMNNYLNLTADGAAELRKLSDNQAFYVENKGGFQYTLKMKDGRYLGLDDTRKNGTRVKAVSTPYVWLIHWEATNFNRDKADIFSLRPPEATNLVVNASGEKNTDGTPVIIWTHEKMDAPNHAEFRFIPLATVPDSTGETWSVYSENGLEGYKDLNGNVVIKAQFDSAEKFSQGIAKVYSNTKGVSAYIDTTGKLITPYKYYSAASGHIVYDGLMKVAVYSDEVTNAVMNGDGVEYLESIADKTIVGMKSGKKLKFDAKYGFIDKTGKEVIPLQFDEAYSFQDGMATVLKYQGWYVGFDLFKIGYIDTTGKLVIPYQFGGENSYDGSVFCYKEGLTCFFEYLGEKGLNKDGWVTLPSGGIMDKKGKVIVPSHPERYYPSLQFGLQWKDGVIANTYTTEANKTGVPEKGGGIEWSFSELYDYSGKLIKKLDGYVEAMPLGGGFTLALHQVPYGKTIKYLDTESYVGYWTVFDRNGKIVVDNVQENNFYLLNSPYGYANGYIYFGGESYKVSEPQAVVTPTPTPPPAETTVTAIPTDTKFMLNGQEVALPAYAISGNNYVKLRDVAALLVNRFDVRWEDGKAKLYNHATYTKVGGELVPIGKESKIATLSTTNFVWGDTGAAVTGLTAYTIGDNNFIKLRDIAKLFDFDVDWRDGKAWIEPDVSPYTDD